MTKVIIGESWNSCLLIKTEVARNSSIEALYYEPINCLPHYPPGATCGEGRGIFHSFEQKTYPKGGEFDLILEII